MITQDLRERLGAALTDELDGTGLTWAVVLWPPGRVHEAAEISVGASDLGKGELRAALANAIGCVISGGVDRS